MRTLAISSIAGLMIIGGWSIKKYVAATNTGLAEEIIDESELEPRISYFLEIPENKKNNSQNKTVGIFVPTRDRNTIRMFAEEKQSAIVDGGGYSGGRNTIVNDVPVVNISVWVRKDSETRELRENDVAQPLEFSTIYNISDFTVDNIENGISISQKLAADLDVKVGDEVQFCGEPYIVEKVVKPVVPDNIIEKEFFQKYIADIPFIYAETEPDNEAFYAKKLTNEQQGDSIGHLEFTFNTEEAAQNYIERIKAFDAERNE